MRNIGSKLFVLLLVAAVAVGVGYAFVPQPVDVDVASIERGMLRVTVDEDGKTRIREKYVVSAPLAGQIVRINMKPGDPVTAETSGRGVDGATLLTVIKPRDPELLDARTIAQAEFRVSGAEAALRKAETAIAQAEDAQAFAEVELKRKQAAGPPTVSRSELDAALLEYRQRSEELRSAKIAQEIARFELQQAQAALMRSRPRIDDTNTAGPPTGSTESQTVNHDDMTNGWNFPIHSPISGRVLRVFQESAAYVTPGTPLLEVGDPLDLEAEVDVLSRDAVRIDVGDLVLFEHWGGPYELTGRVRVIEPSGFTKISTLGVEEQRVNVIIDLVNPPHERKTLGDGFRVEARIVIDEVTDIIKAPTSALFRFGGEHAVFRVAGDRVERQIVKIGHQNGLEAEILEGLSEGDRVVLHPSDQIEPGVQVRPRTTATK